MLPRTLIALAFVVGCGDKEEDTDPVDNEGPIVSNPVVAPGTPTTIDVDALANYTITGLDDRQAYRITMVHGDQITAAGDGTATFQDNDANGAADAGPSEQVAIISNVNGTEWIPGSKTVPSTQDDPANPTGVYPVAGQITITVKGVGTGSAYPVAYHNGGASTFLEIEAGVPIETYAVGGAVQVEGPPPPPEISVSPAGPATVPTGEYYDYTVSDLDPAQAYRITLVHADNVTPGPDQGGTFVDNDANGAADAGPSEEVANITQVNGEDLPGAKTVPGGDDDPAAPTGVYPDAAGNISVRITGLASGTIYPVAYTNGGTSTFLEIDAAGSPIEPYAVGGSLTVTP